MSTVGPRPDLVVSGINPDLGHDMTYSGTVTATMEDTLSEEPTAEPGEVTDFWALEHGFVSVTPLHFDLTVYQQMERLGAGRCAGKQ